MKHKILTSSARELSDEIFYDEANGAVIIVQTWKGEHAFNNLVTLTERGAKEAADFIKVIRYLTNPSNCAMLIIDEMKEHSNESKLSR